MEVAVISSRGENVSAAIWNPFTNSLLSSYSGGGTCSPHGLVVSGGFLITNEINKPMLHAWPLNKQHHINKRLIAPGKITCVSISPDTNYIAVSVDCKLHVYQTASGVLCGIGGNHFQSINVIKFNPEGTFIGCGGEDGLLTLWHMSDIVQLNQSSKKPFLSLNAHSLPITDLIFTGGDLRARVITSSLDRSCKIHDVWTKDKLFGAHFENQLTALTICPRESAFYIGDADGYIREINLLAPQRKVNVHYSNASNELVTVKYHNDRVTCLSVSLDCSLLLSGSEDSTVKLIHIKSRQCLQMITQKGPVTNCFFNVIPLNCFSTTFKPSFELNDFVSKESVEYCFNIITPSDISSDYDHRSEDSGALSNFVDNASAETLSEVINLKKINNDLYLFALDRILNKAHKHQETSDLVTNEVENSCSSKSFKAVNSKKKKRRR